MTHSFEPQAGWFHTQQIRHLTKTMVFDRLFKALRSLTTLQTTKEIGGQHMSL